MINEVAFSPIYLVVYFTAVRNKSKERKKGCVKKISFIDLDKRAVSFKNFATFRYLTLYESFFNIGRARHFSRQALQAVIVGHQFC